MADVEHLAVLRQGVGAWNAWREPARLHLEGFLAAEGQRAEGPLVSKRAALSLFGCLLIPVWFLMIPVVLVGSVWLLRGWLLGKGQRDGPFPADQECGRPDLRGANLRGASLSGAFLAGADLSRADLRGADLRRTDLRWANLAGAILYETDLRWSDLRGADLRRADLRRAALTRVDLRRANLRGARRSTPTELLASAAPAGLGTEPQAAEAPIGAEPEAGER